MPTKLSFYTLCMRYQHDQKFFTEICARSGLGFFVLMKMYNNEPVTYVEALKVLKAASSYTGVEYDLNEMDVNYLAG